MNAFFTTLWALPFLEIIGFIVIGGEIGLLASLLWLAGSIWLGFYLFARAGQNALPTNDEEVFSTERLFNHLCLMGAALLLIFPGFLSDLLAVFLLIPAFRNNLRHAAQKNPRHPARRFVHVAKSTSRRMAPTIEGEYKKHGD